MASRVATRSPFVDLEQGAVWVGKVVFNERFIHTLHIHEDALIFLVQVQFGVVAPVRPGTMRAEDFSDNRFAEQTAELYAVVQGCLPQTDKPLTLFVLVKLDQEAALVGLIRIRRAVALEAD